MLLVAVMKYLKLEEMIFYDAPGQPRYPAPGPWIPGLGYLGPDIRVRLGGGDGKGEEHQK